MSDEHSPHTRRSRIAALNDRFRKEPTRYGEVYITAGIAAYGAVFQAKAMAAVAAFDAFTGDNDPHGEHDFGCLTVDAIRVFFKIDYHSRRDRNLGAEAPENDSTTLRVMTLMMPEDY